MRGALVTPRTNHRAAITTPTEAGGLLRAVEDYDDNNLTRIALCLLPHLFVRPGELRWAEWSEFDFDKSVWTIPDHKMKMRDIWGLLFTHYARPHTEILTVPAERARLGQLFAEQKDRAGIRRRRVKIEAEEAQPTKSVADQILHPRVGHIVLCREHQGLAYRHRIVRRAPALRAVAMASAAARTRRNPSKSMIRLSVRPADRRTPTAALNGLTIQTIPLDASPPPLSPSESNHSLIGPRFLEVTR